MQLAPADAYAQLIDAAQGWKQAITCACEPLLESCCVGSEWCDALIENAHKVSGRDVVSSYVILPAGRIIPGVRWPAISVLLLGEPFRPCDHNMSIRLLVLIAAPGLHEHLDTLMCISSVLDDPVRLEKILSCTGSYELGREFWR